METISRDEEAQKKGFVCILDWVGCRHVHSTILDCFRKMRIIMDALPVRLVAMHSCYDISQLRPMMFFIQNTVGRAIRLRFRAHYG